MGHVGRPRSNKFYDCDGSNATDKGGTEEELTGRDGYHAFATEAAVRERWAAAGAIELYEPACEGLGRCLKWCGAWTASCLPPHPCYTHAAIDYTAALRPHTTLTLRIASACFVPLSLPHRAFLFSPTAPSAVPPSSSSFPCASNPRAVR